MTKENRTYNGERIVSSKMVLGKLDSHMKKIINCRNTITHRIFKMYSKWIEDVNVKSTTIKLRPQRLDPRERTRFGTMKIL